MLLEVLSTTAAAIFGLSDSEYVYTHTLNCERAGERISYRYFSVISLSFTFFL